MQTPMKKREKRLKNKRETEKQNSFLQILESKFD